MKNPKFSIVIPSFRRLGMLNKCIRFISKQTYKNYEILIERGKGDLTKIKNEGIAKAKGDIVCFIDDDVEVSPNWLQTLNDIYEYFENVGGVGGPTFIRKELRQNRDLIKFHENNGLLNKVYNKFVLYDQKYALGKFFKSGATSIGSNFEEIVISPRGRFYLMPAIKVDYLEACNMSFRKNLLEKVGGFDTNFKGVGDWSEPDLCFRIRKLGYDLYYHPAATVYHNVEKSRTKIADTRQRMLNQIMFQKRWFGLNWRFFLNLIYINGYYIKKFIETRNHSWLGGVWATRYVLSAKRN